MRLSEEAGARFLDLIKVEEERQWPSFKLDVQLDAEIINCRRSVWVSDDALLTFGTALSKLEERRKGQALLEGMSPDEFHLTIAVIDTAGHVQVSVHLGKEQHWPRGSKYSVTAEFEIDPSSLPRLITEMHELRISSIADES